MNDAFYCYPETDVLKNKLDLKSQSELEKAEEYIVYTAYVTARNNPIKGNFDFDHLKSIHKAIFSDVYEWAGNIRLVDISKINHFCPSQFINSFGNDIFRNLKNDNYLKGLSKDEFVEKFSECFSDLNALHPFREGNGRTLRLFMTYVANNAGYSIEFDKMNKEMFMDACIVSVGSGNNKLLADIFKDIIYANDNQVQPLDAWMKDVRQHRSNKTTENDSNKSISKSTEKISYNVIDK